MRKIIKIGALSLTVASTCLAASNVQSPSSNNSKLNDKPNVVIFVWDGLRPDSVSPNITPNLYSLTQKGVWFNDNHSSYPTFTMMNASSFATGDFAGKTGFYGNTLWQPKAKGIDSADHQVNFKAPVFTEDYKILQDLNSVPEEPLLEVTTLFQQAQKNGMKTAAVGKSGAAFMQDHDSGGVIFDEKHVYPETFAKYLKDKGYILPYDTRYAYKDFNLKGNANPTGYGKVATLKDGVTSDPVAGITSPYTKDNTYLMKSYLNEVMPYAKPQLSVVWLRNPDTTEHNYGVGSTAYYNALKNQDYLLGLLIEKLKKEHLWKKTDLIVVSDHAHSNVSASLRDFPLRNINEKTKTVGAINEINGYSVSGDFRPADLLTRAGFQAFDGEGCQYDPVLSGITKDGKYVYPTKYDTTGKVCEGGVKESDTNGHRHADLGIKYTTPSYKIPNKLPKNSVIVAANGGSTYLYVPSHNKSLIEKLVKFLQSRQEFGVIFIDGKRYGDIPGTFPLSLVHLENKSKRNPDIIVGSNFNSFARVKGYVGTEFNSDGSDRGMHGSFSPIDVHNTLVAYGPSFKSKFTDEMPTGNVDLAPTIAHILGLSLPHTDGRVLYEALKGQKVNYTIKLYQLSTKTVNNLKIQSAENPDGKVIVPDESKYKAEISIKELNTGKKVYNYFDQAKTTRFE
ncbi:MULTISPECIES: alkaline phosphatase family protein [unclassified Francisella]|uniref:alkaline phosphatase family protein n=1 Tax=unclassified Francisella TaxID=2610885 RepID=UPI002E31EAFB|nr:MULTISPECIES: alkaline phosphatase family protein [unclassified Francisella]MED7818666.1 alkaline phosphatase family protein [Francisella sp. 19S2-4]MED7829502.1 alkaline phosphatase family protein [Francisella sp. 19S2-10]